MEPLVSVVCCAYNHENYIRNALDGFVMQKTDFPFEVLVHDDASTDRTADIIREYEEKFPDIIKPIYQTENKYSKGIHIPMEYQYPRARGKYIALCEGDDYWTDPMKLQRQVEALEAHPEIDICTCSTAETENGKPHGYCAPSDHDTVFTPDQVIRGGGTFVSTCSIMIRTELLLTVPRYREILPFDYSIQVQGSLRGGMMYLSDCMCVYRRFSVGSWNSKHYADPEKRIAFDRKMLEMLTALDEETEGRYSEAVNYKIKENQFYALNSSGRFSEMYAPEFREIYSALPLKNKIKLRIRCMIPGAIKLYRSIRAKRYRSGK